MNIKTAFQAQDRLGEGPVWSGAEEALYWVDIERPFLQRWHPQTNQYQSWSMPSRIGCFALRQQGGVLVGLQDGLYYFDLTNGDLACAHLFDPNPGLRINDGKCDRNGRFWFGTMDMNERDPIAALYRWDGNGRCHTMRRGVIISNGLGWSPDNRTFYYTDSPAQTIYAYDFDLENGRISHERLFAQDTNCYPDGLTVDAAGFIWSAKWDGWKIVRYAPDGRIDREIPLPVQRPTSCTFGGPALNQLFITSASVGLTAAEQAAQPAAGSLLVLDAPVPGLPEPYFAG